MSIAGMKLRLRSPASCDCAAANASSTAALTPLLDNGRRWQTAWAASQLLWRYLDVEETALDRGPRLIEASSLAVYRRRGSVDTVVPSSAVDVSLTLL